MTSLKVAKKIVFCLFTLVTWKSNGDIGFPSDFISQQDLIDRKPKVAEYELKDCLLDSKVKYQCNGYMGQVREFQNCLTNVPSEEIILSKDNKIDVTITYKVIKGTDKLSFLNAVSQPEKNLKVLNCFSSKKMIIAKGAKKYKTLDVKLELQWVKAGK